MVVVKLCSGSDIRRVTIADNAIPSFAEFERLVARLYCEDEHYTGRRLNLVYADDEGDNVNVTSTTELLEAIECATSGNRPLRLQVSPGAAIVPTITTTTTTTTTTVPEVQKPVVVEAAAVITPVQTPAPIPAPVPSPLAVRVPAPIAAPVAQQQPLLVKQQVVPQPQQMHRPSAFVPYQREQPTTYTSPLNELMGAVETVVKSDEVREVVRNIEQFPSVVGSFITNVVAAVTESSPSAPTRKPSSPCINTTSCCNNNNNKPTHAAFCDVCQRAIQGVRYKCAVCADYDLCEVCEQRATSVHDSQHAFIKIRTPSAAYKRAVPLPSNNHCSNAAPSRPMPSRCPYVASQQRASPPRNRTVVVTPQRQPEQKPVVIHTEQPVVVQQPILASRFVADVTLGDGTACYVDSRVTKVWRLQNNGTVAWPADTVLAYASGHSFATPHGAALPEICGNSGGVQPGATIDVSVDLVVPRAPGRYASVFVLKSASAGGAFGHRFWVDLVAVPQPQPSPQQQQQPQSQQPLPQQQQQQHAPQVRRVVPEDAKVRQLVEMGFSEEAARNALQRTKRNVQQAVEQLLRTN